MKKINLYEELVTSRIPERTPEEELIIKEKEALDKMDSDDAKVLSKLGMSHDVVTSSKVINEREQRIKGYDRRYVFHIDEISRLCINYGLRFLPSEKFKGNLPTGIGKAILDFEEKYSFNVNRTNSMIAAPKESFILSEKPKDPLLFVKLSKTHYYLLFKWGEDISWWRWFYNIGKRSGWGILAKLYVTAFIGSMLTCTYLIKTTESHPFICMLGAIPVAGILGLMTEELFGATNDETWDQDWDD